MSNDIPDTAALRALLDDASPAPWTVQYAEPHEMWIVYDNDAEKVAEVFDKEVGLTIAGLRNQGAALLDALAAAREENAGLVADLNAVMAQRDKALSAASREVAVNAEVAAAREELAEARRERDHLRRVLDAANATTESAQRIVAAALADGTATFLPAINSAGVGVGNCNCQAIKGTPNFPGPWHPRGDTPTCPKAAVPANGGQPCPECGASGDESCRTPGGVRRWDHTGRAPQTGDGEQAAEASTDDPWDGLPERICPTCGHERSWHTNGHDTSSAGCDKGDCPCPVSRDAIDEVEPPLSAVPSAGPETTGDNGETAC
jgi:hypothetical protein